MVRKGFSNTVISLLICSLLISCKSSARQIIELDDYYYSFITQEEIEEKGFIKKLNEFDSEITICFEDKEHFKHLYVFAAPIRYQDKFGSKLVLIDDRIVDCLESDETYRYEVANSDIITKFPTILSSDNGIFLEKGCGIEYYPQSEKSVEALYECHPNLIGESIDMIVYENLLDNVGI